LESLFKKMPKGGEVCLRGYETPTDLKSRLPLMKKDDRRYMR